VNACVFTGPTIPAAHARQHLDALYLPPAGEGDVYRAALMEPRAIGLIDGSFHVTPSVRHKEILWAMSHGIHVFGCASMGALRAAELAAFGMQGIGVIFEMYRDRILEDDDEVALVHAPSEMDFRPGSEAMVNIRQTLDKAQRLGIISRHVQMMLERLAKETYYPRRNYSLLLRQARQRGLSDRDATALERWLPAGRVDQKREDAVAMLQMMHSRLASGLEPKKVIYHFEYTVMWEAARQRSDDFQTDPTSLLTLKPGPKS